jgi:hypothetical protein
VRALNQAAFNQVQGRISVNLSLEQSDLGADDSLSVDGFSEGAASRMTVSTCAQTEATAAKMAGEVNNWDSSIRVGDNADATKATALPSNLRAAEESLIENPGLKCVHSTASVKTMLARVENHAIEVWTIIMVEIILPRERDRASWLHCLYVSFFIC